MTYDELKEMIKDAMRARDKDRLSILRQVHGELKDIEVNERREVTDEDVTARPPKPWRAPSKPATTRNAPTCWTAR